MAASPPESPAFLADSMVGKLARWLRLLGFDVRYERNLDDPDLVAVAGDEGRILLTRDRRLVERRACKRYVLLDSDDPWVQLREVVEALDLPVFREHWFRRCLECSRPLVPVKRGEVEGEVPPYVHANHGRFARCETCDRIYWRGTHVNDMLQRLEGLLRERRQQRASASSPSAGARATSWALGLALTLFALGWSVPGAAACGRGADAGASAHSDQVQESFADARAALLAELEAQGIRDERVLVALDRVPRHLFVAEGYRDMAYNNHPLPIGHGQTISQPYIVALMSELLEVRQGTKVLEIGTGSGYQAAVLAELGCEVFSIEIVPALGALAARNLELAGYAGVHLRIGDGYLGWPEAAPFDRVIVTAAPEEIPERLVEQLVPGGKMVVPVGPVYGSQVLMLLEKGEDGAVRVRRVLPVRFVPMVHDAKRP